MYGYREAIGQELEFYYQGNMEEQIDYFKVWICYRLLQIWNIKYREKPSSLLIIRRELTLSSKHRLFIRNTNEFSITNGIITIDICSVNNRNLTYFHFFNSICNYSCKLELNLQHTMDFIEEILSISQQIETDARNWAIENYKIIKIKEIEKTTESAYVHD